jgi:hypothetical protein
LLADAFFHQINVDTIRSSVAGDKLQHIGAQLQFQTVRKTTAANSINTNCRLFAECKPDSR